MEDYIFEVDYREQMTEEEKIRNDILMDAIIEGLKESAEEESEKLPLIILPENKKKFDDMVILMEKYCKEKCLKGKCVISRKEEKAYFTIYTGCTFFEVEEKTEAWDMLQCIANNADYFIVELQDGELVVKAVCWYFT